MEEDRKNIDESYKDAVQKEKESLHDKGQFFPPEPDFSFFVTTLGLQASIFLGVVPNPATNKNEEDMVQAKFVIDTLGVLKDKTGGNLTKEEADLLENILYELRLQYVNKSNKGQQTGAGESKIIL